MSLLVLLKNRVTGQPVVADDDDNEWLNIIDCLSGSSIDKSIRIRNNDNAFAVARFDQLGTNKIIELFKNGLEVGNFDNNGNLEIIGSTPHLRVNRNVAVTRIVDIGIDNADNVGIFVQAGPTIFTASMATGVVTFPVQPVFPNNSITVTKSWLYTVLPAAVETVESQPRFIVPSVGLNTITRIYGVWTAGADSGASNVFTIKRRNSAGALQSDVGTIDINTPAQNAIQNNDIADVPLTAGDQIYPLFTTRNTASEQMVTISIEIAVKLS